VPIKRCKLSSGKLGYKWGSHGKCYAKEWRAKKQAAAAYASGYKKKKR